MSEIKTIQTLSIDGIDVDTFLQSNKKTTTDYRAAFAQAIGTTGTIDNITQMAFGDKGETDAQGNPAVPTDNGALNRVVLTKDITGITYPIPTTVQFEVEIQPDEFTGEINEVALIDKSGNTAAKMRLLTDKGIDAESGAIFRWQVEF